MKNLAQISTKLVYLLVSFALLLGNEQVWNGLLASIYSESNITVSTNAIEDTGESNDFPILEKEGWDATSVSYNSVSLNKEFQYSVKQVFTIFVDKVNELAINVASPPPQQA